DSTRDTSPLRAADDAHTVDTSDLALEDVICEVLDIVDAQRRKQQMR
ncbi:MAG: (d)CMP kinase, partial [Acidimicrobiia bacterium]|nr:(d)CMP kinase [Acidimicrobiia bacterium]